jgi:hypothetical protein
MGNHLYNGDKLPLSEADSPWLFCDKIHDKAVELKKIKVPELKEMLRIKGLSRNGKKDELVERLLERRTGTDTGKWMLFYPKSKMNEAWVLARQLYLNGKLDDDIVSMKCSTNYENPRASSFDEGVIILYCYNSTDEDKIMRIGKKIIEAFAYKERQIIYYKTDMQTREGTRATGCHRNYMYKLGVNIV